jgi:hypothetical protein
MIGVISSDPSSNGSGIDVVDVAVVDMVDDDDVNDDVDEYVPSMESMADVVDVGEVDDDVDEYVPSMESMADVVDVGERGEDGIESDIDSDIVLSSPPPLDEDVDVGA